MSELKTFGLGKAKGLVAGDIHVERYDKEAKLWFKDIRPNALHEYRLQPDPLLWQRAGAVEPFWGKRTKRIPPRPLVSAILLKLAPQPQPHQQTRLLKCQLLAGG